MIHKFSRLLMTLVALFAMTAGAWAQEETLLTTILSTGDNASFKSGSMTFDDKVTVTFSNTVKNYGDDWGWYCDLTESLLTVAGINGYTITSCKFYAQDGTADYTVEGESPSVYLSGSNVYTDDSKSVKIGSHGVTKIEVYGYAAPAGPEVTWDAATKTGTFDMPASDVVLTPIYAPVAQWATESDVELLPTAAEGVIAGTDAPLIVEGTVAPGQGTVMYAVTSTNQATAPELSAFSATVPTAENIADEGADVLVWYYIQGADTPDGQTATAENTFNDSEICATPLEVSVLSNKFDITFNAANANTIEGQNGKGTVTVKTGDADAVDKTADIDENHQLKAVKMGSTVTINAKQGYKFRKVEVKKTGPAVLAPALENGATVVINCNWGYGGTTTFTYTNNGGTFSGQASGYDAYYFNNGLELNGKNLSFGTWNVDNSDGLSVGITFNTESSAYSYTGKGSDFVSFTISVNGTDVTDQLSELK